MLSNDLIQGAQAAAEYTGLNRRTIYAMVAGKSLPHIKRGKLLFFRKSELNEVFRSNLVTA